MEAESKNQQGIKISPNFRARLSHLEPTQKVRAIVLLRTPDGEAINRQESRANRKSLIKRVREAAATALPDIDAILERFGGKRLAESADALGSIPVETTPAGVQALAASEHVKTILEDQPISSLLKLKQA
jgi:hypothetical protein